jgi:hypothetical protein
VIPARCSRLQPEGSLVVAADGLGEAGARVGDGVVEDVLGDEAAAALLDADEAFRGRLIQRSADGVAVDAEADGELGFGGQSAARRQAAVGDVGFERRWLSGARAAIPSWRGMVVTDVHRSLHPL